MNKVATADYKVSLQFKRLRPKYDYYVLTQYTDQQNFVMSVTEQIATASVSFDAYSQLTSLVFIEHLKKESIFVFFFYRC